MRDQSDASHGSSPRRLTRGVDHRLGGVCGGIAEYFAVDPTLVRIGFVLFAVLSAGAGALLAYAVLWAIMPPPTEGGRTPAAGGSGAMAFGVVVLVIGVAMAVQGLQMFAWMSAGMFRIGWPFALIMAGTLIILASRRR